MHISFEEYLVQAPTFDGVKIHVTDTDRYYESVGNTWKEIDRPTQQQETNQNERL